MEENPRNKFTTLNGNFHQGGKSPFQYCEFPKPWKDRKKGDYWLGLEVIFSDKLNLEDKVSYESRTED